MSKTLLSRIRPLHNPKPKPISSITPRIKELVNETLYILKTRENWPEFLDDRFTDEELRALDIAPFVFDRIRDLEVGIKFFDWLSKRQQDRLLSDGHASSSFLKLLARFRVFHEIGALLENLRIEKVKPTHDALNHVLRAYANSGFVDKALEVYKYVIESYDSAPDVFACNALLQLLVKSKRLDDARKIYNEMRERDGCVDNYSTCIVVKGLCSEGKIEEGKKVIEDRFGRGCVPNIVFYNIIIDGYCKKGDVESANLVFKELKLKGFLPTLETYGAMINGFCKKGDFVVIDRLLAEMKERGLNVNVQLFNNIVDARYKHGLEGRENQRSWTNFRRSIAKGMSERGCKPDIVVYGVLIHGLVTSGHVDDALMIKDKLLNRGTLPDTAIYNILMNGLCKKGRFPAAKLIFSEMLDQNILPDAFVYATLIDGFIRNGDLDEAGKVFSLSIENGVKADAVGYNTMIKGFCKYGSMDDALVYVNKMTEEHLVPDEFTYSTIISGYVKQQDMANALKIFQQMIKRKCKPNVVTYTSLINGFCCQGDSKMAEETFREMQSCGLVPNVVTYTTLIRNFVKVGNLEKAVCYFELMLVNKCVPNDVTFNCFLQGFVKNAADEILAKGIGFHQEQKSLFVEFFQRMKSEGWSQHVAAHNSILACLCVRGMVPAACKFQDRMVRKGISPDPISLTALVHGFCMVGNSSQWRNMDFCTLDEKGLHVALRYSQILERHIPQAVASEATLILHSIVEKSKRQGFG
ncbi:PREDICTED: pentatricopeptide repeat-containing protein At1g52620 isoform X4 [Tarenaya hassleriana]|uniref:pentatricopeptide repeat-containing protein At1g52620 isoform X4 n=1 Tax=Tarenaya hassleriana TaxID=28532 RepID=UPI00053C4583|nr:PREDICTED: pentatricopeptide repeat-containing protein At1g52620 isoform X4 [Tarenaya hassleriana]